MSKKKPTGGKHTTVRVNMGIPKDWHAVLRRLAAKQKRPLLYTLVDMLQEKAESEGFTDLPPPPWDEDAGE